jgi:PAS domain S-box-containing protein
MAGFLPFIYASPHTKPLTTAGSLNLTATPTSAALPQRLGGKAFLRRFRWLIFHSWNIPPIFGLTFILIVGVLTPAQLVGILLTPLEPAYILGWLAFSLWYLPRQIRPLSDWLDAKPGCSPEAALQAMRRFPLRFWSIFLIYLAVAPLSVIAAAHLYTDYQATLIDLFRIELIALIVSIIVGLPIFFLILDLFGRAVGGIELKRPFVTIKTKVFLIGALVPLLIDTMLVQYYWARTGYFTTETFFIWLLLEGLAIAGSLIFAHSFGQSLAPLRASLAESDPLTPTSLAALRPQSTDELGILTHRYRQALDELRVRTEILEVTNRLLRQTRTATSCDDTVTELINLCQEALGGDQVFLLLLAPSGTTLLGVAQTGLPYDPEGHFQIGMEEHSLAVSAIRRGDTISIADCSADPRVNPRICERFNLKSALATPLRAGGQMIGVLITSTQHARHEYAPREIQLMEALAREVAVVVETQRLRDAQAAAETARREREEQVKLLLDSTAEAIYGVDAYGMCTFVNPACVRMLGYVSEADLLGRNMHALIHHTYPDGRHYPKEECLVRLSVHEGLSAHSDQEVHWRADGSSFPVEYWSHPMYRDGELVGAVVTFVDITERVLAEQALLELNASLEQRVADRTAELALINHELEAFSYSVSHDLRAPLRAIDGFSQALLEDYSEKLDDTGKNYLKRVRNGAQRMSDLIDDLLKLSRVTRSPMQSAAVDISRLSRDIVEDLRLAHPERQVSVSIQSQLGAKGDPGLLRSALANLLGNAWKYSSRRPDACIEFGASVVDGETVFFVRDNGAGFDMQYADKLFGAFQRLHGPNEFEGSGIGLATVQRIIHRHGGRVWAEGWAGRGAVFYFTLGDAPSYNRQPAHATKTTDTCSIKTVQ